MAIALMTDVINIYICINPVWLHAPVIGTDPDTLYHRLGTTWGTYIDKTMKKLYRKHCTQNMSG